MPGSFIRLVLSPIARGFITSMVAPEPDALRAMDIELRRRERRWPFGAALVLAAVVSGLLWAAILLVWVAG